MIAIQWENFYHNFIRLRFNMVLLYKYHNWQILSTTVLKTADLEYYCKSHTPTHTHMDICILLEVIFHLERSLPSIFDNRDHIMVS